MGAQMTPSLLYIRYLLENTQDVLDKYHMQTHDVLLFGRTKEGVYAVCGRKGTRDDVIRCGGIGTTWVVLCAHALCREKEAASGDDFRLMVFWGGAIVLTEL